MIFFFFSNQAQTKRGRSAAPVEKSPEAKKAAKTELKQSPPKKAGKTTLFEDRVNFVSIYVYNLYYFML